MEFVIYLIVAVVVVINVISAQRIGVSRKALDLTKPENVKKDKQMRIAIAATMFNSLLVAIILIFVVKPLVT